MTGIGGQELSSGADSAYEASNADEGQGAADIVGQRCQTELASDILDAACEEVPLPHPLLYRAKRVFHGMRCLRPIEIFGVHMLTGIWLSRA